MQVAPRLGHGGRYGGLHAPCTRLSAPFCTHSAPLSLQGIIVIFFGLSAGFLLLAGIVNTI